MGTTLRRLLGSCALFVALANGTLLGASMGEMSARPLPASARLAITHGPLLQAPSETGITISWSTSQKCVSWVEYRSDSSPHWLTNQPAHHGLVDADVTVHNVPLAGLTPGTRYHYRAVSREIPEFKAYNVRFGATVASPEGSFATLDARKPSAAFVVVNDRHENVAALTASLASVAWDGVDLAFLNGDMVNDVKNEAQLYRCLVDPCTQSFAGRLPLVYVRGNHDTRGSFARRLMDYFPTQSGRYYYTLRQGPATFLILDSGEDKGDGNVEYSGLVDFDAYLREQVEWLARHIEEPAFRNAPFRICLMHIPPDRRPDSKFIRPKWLLDHVVPLLNRGEVNLLICGHTHQYAVFPAGRDGLNFPMITGGAQTVIRCEVTADQITTSVSDLSGKPLPPLPPVRLSN